MPGDSEGSSRIRRSDLTRSSISLIHLVHYCHILECALDLAFHDQSLALFARITTRLRLISPGLTLKFVPKNSVGLICRTSKGTGCYFAIGEFSQYSN